MPSVFSHAIAATALAKVTQPQRTTWWYWVLGPILSAVPDLDVIGFRFGVHYGDVMGHRGFTHSIFFAVVLAGLVSLVFIGQHKISFWRLFIYLFLAIESHGVLDAMTNGGLGVAFFSPFSNRRYFFPFRPIQVSPIGAARFFGPKGLSVLHSEFLWIWLPSIAIFLAITLTHSLFTIGQRRTRAS